MEFLKLFRWFHELVAILPFLGSFLVLRYYAGISHVHCELPAGNFIVVCICVQLLIAAGCVLNDIMDRNIDLINKPKTHLIGKEISLAMAKKIFIALTFLIILLSVYISCYMFKEWAFISAGVYILSILYDLYFKRWPLIGNILIAFLASFIPLVLVFFAKECIGILNNDKINTLIWFYSLFPFLIIIPRELSLDISDIEGDKVCGCKTLPILIGIEKAKIVVVFFICVIIALSIFVAFKYPYLIFTVCITDIMLVCYIYFFQKAQLRIEYIKAGRFLWFIMIMGMVGITISTIICK